MHIERENMALNQSFNAPVLVELTAEKIVGGGERATIGTCKETFNMTNLVSMKPHSNNQTLLQFSDSKTAIVMESAEQIKNLTNAETQKILQTLRP